jgi:hypothetical protein
MWSPSNCEQEEQFGSPKVGKSCTASLRQERGKENLKHTDESRRVEYMRKMLLLQPNKRICVQLNTFCK